MVDKQTRPIYEFGVFRLDPRNDSYEMANGSLQSDTLVTLVKMPAG